jgi:hypothetical protein
LAGGEPIAEKEGEMIRMGGGGIPRHRSGESVQVTIEEITATAQAKGVLWAKPLGGDIYELENAGSLITGFNFKDIVLARTLPGDSMPTVVEVVRRSGYESLHLVFSRDVAPLEQQRVLEGLNDFGARSEKIDSRFYVIIVDPDGDPPGVCDYLKSLDNEGLLKYEPGVDMRGLVRFFFT